MCYFSESNRKFKYSGSNTKGMSVKESESDRSGSKRESGSWSMVSNNSESVRDGGRSFEGVTGEYRRD